MLCAGGEDKDACQVMINKGTVSQGDSEVVHVNTVKLKNQCTVCLFYWSVVTFELENITMPQNITVDCLL
jgi:hypothetical protein